MQEDKGGAGRFGAVSRNEIDIIGKRDADRTIYRETHVSKRAKRFITVSGNRTGTKDGAR